MSNVLTSCVTKRLKPQCPGSGLPGSWFNPFILLSISTLLLFIAKLGAWVQVAE